PACKRIIKVPLPVKREPQDWRKVETQGPRMARREDELPPEGAWGTAARPGTVSEEALEEAGALPEEEREPLTLGQKIRRGLLAAGGLAVLLVGWLVLRNYWAKSLQDKAVAQALAYVEGKDVKAKVAPVGAAEVYRALGELDLQANKGPAALNNFKKPRAQLRPAGDEGPSEGDAVLRDLALAQVNLAGSNQQVEDKARLKWEDAAKQWRQTLNVITVPEARVAAARSVCRELIARGQWPLAADLVR